MTNTPKLINMPIAFAFIAGVILIAGLSAPVMADEAVPDLKGTWKAEVTGISLGDPASGLIVDADAKPKIETISVEMTIDFQEGRAISGVKKYKNSSERFIAVFRDASTSLHGTDAEGDMDMTILPSGWIESCYTEHGKSRAYASCPVYHRARH